MKSGRISASFIDLHISYSDKPVFMVSYILFREPGFSKFQGITKALQSLDSTSVIQFSNASPWEMHTSPGNKEEKPLVSPKKYLTQKLKA